MRTRLTAVIVLFFFFADAAAQTKNTAVPVIFDTDMGPDYDDVGAITILHHFADRGKINILATIASDEYEGVAAVLSVLNTYFKKPEIPIGIPAAGAVDQRDFQHWTDTLIARYPHALKRNADAHDAVTLYRSLLSKQADHSVVIITVGFLTNIARLLESPPDAESPLSGLDLVRKKVSRMVSMAGRFPAGKEFNIDKDAASARIAFTRFPRPVIYCGFEIGEKVKCGLPLLQDNAIRQSPVKDVFSLCIPQAAEDSAGRKSWDEVTTLVALVGISGTYLLVSGTIEINPDGSNSWIDGKSDQGYLKLQRSPLVLQKTIDRLMKHQPK